MVREMITDTWQSLDPERWRSPVVVIGGSDSGKTTIAGYVYQRLLEHYERVGYVDLDIGQSTLRIPTTVNLCLNAETTNDEAEGKDARFPPSGLCWQCFVGSISPIGHEARLLATLYRLTARARQSKIQALVVDTTGFIDVDYGAAALKWGKIEMLRPCTVVALQRHSELEPIVGPMRRWSGVDVITLPVSDEIRPRSREARRSYRASCYRQYFAEYRRVPLQCSGLAIFMTGIWHRGQVMALEDASGFVLGLVLLDRVSESVVWVVGPRPMDWQAATALRVGNVVLDLDTYEDRILEPSPGFSARGHLGS